MLNIYFHAWYVFHCTLLEHAQRILHTYALPYSRLLAYTRADSRLAPANERRRYFVTTSFIGWAQA